MDKHIVIKKIPGKQRGFNYIVECPVCSVNFAIKGCHFNNNQRIYCSKSCRAKALQSANFTRYKTGKSKKNGYIYLNLLNIYEHRHIMEEHIGRKLKSEECINHIDHNRSNNKITNLEIVTRSENSRESITYHGVRKKDAITGRFI